MSRTSVLIVDGYNIPSIISEISVKYPSLEKDADYLSMEDRFFDYTQACDIQERRQWLTHFIKEGLQDISRSSEMCMPDQRNSRVELEREGCIKILAAYTLMG